MSCNECDRLERAFLESMVTAEKAETALRCYLLTHKWAAGVSDIDEYDSLRRHQSQSMDDRHQAYSAVVEHSRGHA
jgi:hypothetical protein